MIYMNAANITANELIIQGLTDMIKVDVEQMRRKNAPLLHTIEWMRSRRHAIAPSDKHLLIRIPENHDSNKITRDVTVMKRALIIKKLISIREIVSA